MAYQAMLGVGVEVTPQLTLDIGYRYFRVPNLDFTAKGRRTVQVERGDGEYCPKKQSYERSYYNEGPVYDEVSVPYSYGVEGDYVHQAIMVGLRYQFAEPAAPAPPPAPVVPAAPVAICPRSDFTVYFEWDKSNLNAQANEVIDNAIARARECNMSSAAIVGHTDTSGSTAYNVALSERRAAIVRDALAARGVAVSMMTTEARGESDLAQATADGVREPLNRRTAVTITFQ
jgi:outer membrane protein OmpA-like peptidoglycan-associated protein